MNIKIEIAGEEDALRLIEVQNKSFYADFIRFGECPGYNLSIAEMRQRIQKNFMHKIIADGQIIGNLSFRICEEGYYWLGCLAIMPEFQNKGIGSKAIKYIEREYPDAKVWGLETPEQNCRNCHFYEKMGFVRVDEKKHSEEITLRIYEKIMK